MKCIYPGTEFIKIGIYRLCAYALLSLLSLFTFPAQADAAAGYSYSVLYTFCPAGYPACTDGANPYAGLIQDAAGNLYGTTASGGAGAYVSYSPPSHGGTVFKVDTTGHETVLYSFCSVANCADGDGPNAGVIQDAAGNLYGTTAAGGSAGGGTVFKVDSMGHETVLYSFCSVANCADGQEPLAGVIQDAAGNLYGTTYFGGKSEAVCDANSCGVVFKIDPSGRETVLYRFFSAGSGTEEGSNPSAGLILDPAGNLYGTTAFGGISSNSSNCRNDSPGGQGCGTVFKLDNAGHEAVLYAFCSVLNCPDGASPSSGVIEDAAGNLYGTTSVGGANFAGSVFKLSSTGQERVLYNFGPAAGGQSPAGGLVLDAQGNLYGTTVYGGTSIASGIVFKLDTAGNETVLYTFCALGCQDGAQPIAGLIQDAAGNLYGTTRAGGVGSSNAVSGAGRGVVFKLMTPSQTISFGAIPGQKVGTPLTLNATASSDLTVTFSSSTSGVCTISGSTASFIAAGVCGITASQSGNSSYQAATPVLQTFAVSNAQATVSQTITFSSIAPQQVGTPLTLSASANSGLPVTFTSFTTSVCIVSGSTASFLAAGTCIITASQAGNSNYEAALVTQSFPVINTNGSSTSLQFVPLTPCRLVDTRNPSGPFGGPEMTAASTRSFNIPSGSCGVPSTALAYSLNVTVVPQGELGYLSIWPAGLSQPLVSTLNSDGRVKANAAIVPAGTNGGVSVYVSNPTHVILDINGYFVPAGTASAQSFFPLTPCRIADTRNTTGLFGGPFMGGGSTRLFPILSSSCKVPSAAQAYSLNFTVVPHVPLGYLATWPSGNSQPLVSTLNTSTTAATANAAIVPAGTNGAVSVYASNDTDLIIDINGYFAPPSSGGLSLYTVTPCRVLDTRQPSGSPPISGQITVNVAGSVCSLPSSAQAYVVNATVVPESVLGYLSMWPNGESQPLVSTLNAPDQAVTSNMAIVPTTNGSIDAFTSSATHLVLDVSSYFAP